MFLLLLLSHVDGKSSRWQVLRLYFNHQGHQWQMAIHLLDLMEDRNLAPATWSETKTETTWVFFTQPATNFVFFFLFFSWFLIGQYFFSTHVWNCFSFVPGFHISSPFISVIRNGNQIRTKQWYNSWILARAILLFPLGDDYHFT